MTAVNDAVIVAAGLGGRMLPTSAYLPKESLPLVDVPVIIHLIREAIYAGVKRIHIIASPIKDFSTFLEDKNEFYLLKPEITESLFSTPEPVKFHIHIQHEPLGLGHAILQSLDSIDGPCLILLGDNIITDQFSSIRNFKPSTASKKLVMAFIDNGIPCAGIYTVSDNEVCNYGVVELKNSKISQIVEKPSAEDAPSNKVLCGRYVFSEDAKRLLTDTYPVAEFGELQTIELQKHWMDGDGLYAVDLSEYQWYDSGNPLAWLKSQIDYGLRNHDYASELSEWLRERLG